MKRSITTTFIVAIIGFASYLSLGYVKSEEVKPLSQSKIVFQSDRDGNDEIYIMNANGSEQKNLTHHPANDVVPRCSPGGGKIAFISLRSGNGGIYIINTDGKKLKRLTNNPYRDGPMQWSPDGKKIAFYSERKKGDETTVYLYIMNADGSNQQRLTNEEVRLVGGFSWSSDSKQIAFVVWDNMNDEIYIINTDGSGLKRLTANLADDVSPRWSPDGLKIAFLSQRDGTQQLYVMNSDGTRPEKLTDTGCAFFSWSPDSSRIVFVSSEDGILEFEYYIMNSDGNNQERLTYSSIFFTPAVFDVMNYLPVWSTDGKKIAYVLSSNGGLDIYLMNPDGSESIRLTSHKGRNIDPQWSLF